MLPPKCTDPTLQFHWRICLRPGFDFDRSKRRRSCASCVLQVARGDVAGVPSAQVIRLSGRGCGVGRGAGCAPMGRSVKRAAQLLDSLLPADGCGQPVPRAGRTAARGGAGAGHARPAAVRLARGLCRGAGAVRGHRCRGGGRAPSSCSPADIVAAQQPVAAPVEDVKAPTALARVEPFVVADADGRRAPRAQELTVSDIRRARRATGLTLTQIAEAQPHSARRCCGNSSGATC